MGSQVSHLPSRFPVGTRYVIEGRAGRVRTSYLEFPDGRVVALPTSAGRAGSRAGRRNARTRAAKK